jgi:hypothetical protein
VQQQQQQQRQQQQQPPPDVNATLELGVHQLSEPLLLSLNQRGLCQA